MTVAGWAWRLLLLGVVAYLAVLVFNLLFIPTIAIVAAILVTALLRPFTNVLRRAMPGSLASILTLVAALVVVAGVGYLIEWRVAGQLTALTQDVANTFSGLSGLLTSLGLPGGSQLVTQISGTATTWVQQHTSDVTGYLGTGLSYAIEVGTIVVLALFVTFFLLYQGDRVWGWVISPLPDWATVRAERAGVLAWDTLTGYVRGTATIALIHGVVIGGVSFILGVPLALPIGVLIFIGSFLPIIGIIVTGAVAVLIALGTKGLVIGLILLAVLVVEDQLEANLLQPLIVGRYVQLHPLAIGVAIVVGTVLGGFPGAIVAVPVAALVYRAGPALVRPPELDQDSPRAEIGGNERVGGRTLGSADRAS